MGVLSLVGGRGGNTQKGKENCYFSLLILCIMVCQIDLFHTPTNNGTESRSGWTKILERMKMSTPTLFWFYCLYAPKWNAGRYITVKKYFIKEEEAEEEEEEEARDHGLVVSALDFGRQGFEPGHCRRVVSLDKKLYSTLSFFTEVYKWVLAIIMLGVALGWTSI